MTGATPLVRQRATDLRVDLSVLVGTGTGGRITVRDVEAAARTTGQPYALAARKPNTPSYSVVRESTSRFDQRAVVQVDAYAANPLVDDWRQANPTGYARSVADEPSPPTLFPTGDLPLFTAAGFDPSELTALPAIARHAAAAAAGPEAARIFEECGGGDTYAISAAHKHTASRGWQAYEARVRAWTEPSPWDTNGDLKPWADKFGDTRRETTR